MMASMRIRVGAAVAACALAACGGGSSERCAETETGPLGGDGAGGDGAGDLAEGRSGPDAASAGDPAAATRTFARFVLLAGDWHAVESGQTFDAHFEVISRGAAVLQRSGFTALYYRDGGTLMAS